MAAAASKVTGRDAVAEAAREALDAARGDVRRAAVLFEARVRADRSLRDALTDPLIATACYTAVTAQVRRRRQSVWKAPAVPTRSPAPAPAQPRTSDGAFRVAQLAAGTLLMFPLPGGKRLGEATREEISEAACFYEAQSADMAHKARWLRLVAQSLPTSRRVGDVLTDARLRELQEAARGE